MYSNNLELMTLGYYFSSKASIADRILIEAYNKSPPWGIEPRPRLAALTKSVRVVQSHLDHSITTTRGI